MAFTMATVMMGSFSAFAAETTTDVEAKAPITKEAFIEKRTAQIEKAVEAGKITQEEADEMLAHIEEMAEEGNFGHLGRGKGIPNGGFNGEKKEPLTKEAFIEKRTEQIEKALEAGEITQEEADEMLAHMEEMAESGDFGFFGRQGERPEGMGQGEGNGQGPIKGAHRMRMQAGEQAVTAE